MNRERRFGRLGRSIDDALIDAMALCQLSQHQFIEFNHWFRCIWQRGISDLRHFFGLLTVDLAVFERRIDSSIARPREQGKRARSWRSGELRRARCVC
jgi:ATP-dependent Clp protease ATP-binding subunit ClpA